jgi:hypothetical protein
VLERAGTLLTDRPESGASSSLATAPVQYSVDTGRSVPRCPCHSPRLTRLGQLVSLCAESQRSTSAVINHPVERCHDELAQHDIPDTPRAPRHHPRAPAAQPHRPSKRAPHPPQPTHNVGRVQTPPSAFPVPHHRTTSLLSLHVAGPYTKDQQNFPNIYISSYTQPWPPLFVPDGASRSRFNGFFKHTMRLVISVIIDLHLSA